MTTNAATDDQTPMTPEVDCWKGYFGMPIALQLKEPLVAVEMIQEQVQKEDGPYVQCVMTNGIGWPAMSLKRDEAGKALTDAKGAPSIDIEQVLFGSLDRSECGTRLVLTRPTPMGAKAHVSIAPGNVSYVTTLTHLPEPFKIEQPGLIHQA